MSIRFAFSEITAHEPASYILWLIVIIVIGSAIGELLVDITDKRRNEQLVEYLMKEFGRVYFCSYSLWDVFLHQFFPRYRKFVDRGFCAPIAAMAMLALRNNPTARCVYAIASDKRFEHCWCEFRYRGIWYVVDVCWYYPFVLPRNAYYRRNKPRIIKIWHYREFWSWAASWQLYREMLHPETSWLFTELACFYGYGYYTERERFLFHPNIAETTFDDSVGSQINPYVFMKFPDVIFSRRIMHEMMRKPTRKRPPAHLVRRVRGQIRRFRRAVDEQQRQQTVA